MYYFNEIHKHSLQERTQTIQDHVWHDCYLRNTKNQHDITDYIYEEHKIHATNYKNLNKILEKVKYYIESVLFNYSTTESNVKFIYATSVAFMVSRFVKVIG